MEPQHSAEHRRKLSEAMRGNQNLAGRKHSEAAKAKMRAAHARRRAAAQNDGDQNGNP